MKPFSRSSLVTIVILLVCSAFPIAAPGADPVTRRTGPFSNLNAYPTVSLTVEWKETPFVLGTSYGITRTSSGHGGDKSETATCRVFFHEGRELKIEQFDVKAPTASRLIALAAELVRANILPVNPVPNYAGEMILVTLGSGGIAECSVRMPRDPQNESLERLIAELNALLPRPEWRIPSAQ